MAGKAIPVNPELERHPDQIAKTAAAQGTSGIPGEVGGGLPGVVYVTSGVPNMRVKVLPGQNVRVPDDHEVGEGGNYFEGDEFDTHGPTAHMLEARGIVEILKVVD